MGNNINTNYDKISDDLCFLGTNVIVRFNVILAKKGENDKRTSFHKEYEYMLKKYSDEMNLVTIRRQFEYFITMENLKAVDGEKEIIKICNEDFILFKSRIAQTIKWFNDVEFNNLFAIKDDRIIIMKTVDPVDIQFVIGNKSIRIEPIVIDYENNSVTGVRIYLCSLDNYVDVPIDRYMGFVYLISNINMYQSAQLMLNYMGRPNDGTNRMSFGTDNNYNRLENNIEGQNRLVNYKPKSFFNKVDEM